MRIILQSYNTSCQNASGGVNVRIHKIYDLLKKSNINVSFFDKFTTKLSKGDILHIFRIDSENADLVKYAKTIGVKVVISSIFPLMSGIKIDLYRVILNKLPIQTNYKNIFTSFALADCIIAETYDEAAFIKKHFKIPNVVVIPNGSEEIEKTAKTNFNKLLGIEGKYALCVGRFDKNKNQLNLIKALKNTKENVVFVGGPDNKPDNITYFEKCREIASSNPNIRFLGWQSHESDILKSAYSFADVVVIPSFKETFSLVALEAVMSESKLVISKNLPILGFGCFKCCRTINPKDVKEIKKQVLSAFNDEFDLSFKSNIIKVFSWNRIIEDHIYIYKSLIANEKIDITNY